MFCDGVLPQAVPLGLATADLDRAGGADGLQKDAVSPGREVQLLVGETTHGWKGRHPDQEDHDEIDQNETGEDGRIEDHDDRHRQDHHGVQHHADQAAGQKGLCRP